MIKRFLENVDWFNVFIVVFALVVTVIAGTIVYYWNVLPEWAIRTLFFVFGICVGIILYTAAMVYIAIDVEKEESDARESAKGEMIK